MSSDFHLHTFVSDGDLEPSAVLSHAAARGVRQLSITDHDALGAYRWREGEVFTEARRLGLELTVGLEMDADLEGLEVHLLGFAVSLDDSSLNAHLEAVRATRFERARREIGVVNGLLGPGTIQEHEIFVPGRETLMKPHFIHPILAKGHFATYEEANGWYRKNVKTGVSVPKPAFADAVRLIHDAGGWTSLAHPGYYEKSGLAIATRLGDLKSAGLDGVELEYPYHACSPHVFSRADEAAFAEALRAAAEPLELRLTRGSDSHTSGDFERAYGSPWGARD
jgi:hypothetical protein